MLRRVDTLCLVAIALIGMLLPSASATSEASNRTLKGITAVNVLVEKLPSGAQVLGVTEEAIRTDVELKLRLAGMRVVTESESSDQPGSPFIYVLLEVTDSARAAHIELKLEQNARLERNNEFCVADTWHTSTLASNPTAQGIRNAIKDVADEFLNDWLSVNPKK